MELHKKFKIEQVALKVYVFLTGVGFTVYCGMLCFGVRHSLAEFLSMTFAYILLSIAVWVFHLCWLSWAFVLYGYLVRTCMILYSEGVFGEYLDLAHWIAFSVGLVLCCFLFSNPKKYLYGLCKH